MTRFQAFTRCMPDELYAGYVGRLMHLQLCFTQKELRQQLMEAYNGDPIEPDSIDTVARAAGKSRADFVQQHTIIPYVRMTSREPEPKDHHRLSAKHMDLAIVGQRRGMRLRYCPECVSADEKGHNGLSWWRRMHQIGGVDWCPQHRTVLRVARSLKAFEGLPGQIAISDSDSVTADSLSDWPVLDRYIAYMEGVMKRPKPARHADVGQLIGHRLFLARSQCSDTRQYLLSDWVLPHVPRQWLYSHIPSFSKKREGEAFSGIDKVAATHTAGSQTAIGLVLSILCESADEMLGLLAADVNDLPPDRRMKLSNIDELRALYIKHKGSHGALARFLGAPLSSVRLRLDRCGLPAVGGVVRDSSVRAAVDVVEGMAVCDAVEKHQACIERVEAWLNSELNQLLPILVQAVRCRRVKQVQH